jgi:Do/DeqQ family serine protease
MTPLLPLALAAILVGPAFAEAPQVPTSTGQIALSFAPVVKLTAPAVVNIYATQIVQDRVSPFEGDPFFDDFFQNFGPSTPRVKNSLGSGVIVSPDGLVVSNYHVVGEASQIRVVLNDRREFDATVMLADKESDLAVLRLQGAANLPAVTLRDSDTVEVGELVLAIGNPFGVGQTVSSGIVSGLARSSPLVGNGHGYFIQTDAAINPGNSGGALVDTTGQLVGINTAILSKTGGSLGIGFAIPANLVSRVIEQALQGASRFQRPWGGVTGQAVDGSLAEAMGMDLPQGVVLNDLHSESPFAKAGLQSGDVILSLDGQPTNTPEEVYFRMATLGIGAEAMVRYLHGTDLRYATVRLVPPPDSPPRDVRTLGGTGPLRGLTVARINPAVAEELGLPTQAEGVIAIGVDEMAAATGLQVGDIILAINGQLIATTQDVEASASQRSRLWQVDVTRQGQALRLRFRF